MKIEKFIHQLTSQNREEQDKFGILTNYSIGFKFDPVGLARLFHKSENWCFKNPGSLYMRSEREPLLERVSRCIDDYGVMVGLVHIPSEEQVRCQISAYSPLFPIEVLEAKLGNTFHEEIREHQRRIKEYKTSIVLDTKGNDRYEAFENGRKAVIDIARNIIMKHRIPAVFRNIRYVDQNCLSRIVYFEG